MALISMIICIFIFFVSYKKYRKLYAPPVIYSVFWLILIFFSVLRLYSLYETSEYAYTLILFGVIAYFIGTFFASKIIFKGENFSQDYEFKETIYNVLVFICAISLIYNYRLIFIYLRSGLNISNVYLTMAQTASGDVTELSAVYSRWQEQLQQYIAYPLLYTLVPISVIKFSECRRKKYLFVAVFFTAVRFLVDLRRTFLVIVIVYVIVIFIMRYDLKAGIGIGKTAKRRFVIGIVIVGIAFVVFSRLRRGAEADTYNFAYNLYTYYVGSLPYFSQRLETMLESLKYTYGMTSFRGFFAPIFAILGIFGFPEPKVMTEATDFINSLHSVIYNITPSHRFNSYATVFLEFYKDGGVIGVIVLSILFGWISQRYYIKAMRSGSIRFISKYAYFFSVFILLSMLHFNGSVVCYFWPLIIERFLYRKKDIHKKLHTI